MFNNFMGKIQNFGGSMYSTVLLLTFTSIILGISTVFITPSIMGAIAAPGSNWTYFWTSIKTGTDAIMKQFPFLFLLGLPIGLAKKENARCVLEEFVLYMTFNLFIGAILNAWGPVLGVDFTQDVGGTSGLASIGGIKTLDTGVVGALIVSGITVWLHNRYFDKRLPEWLSIFRGSSFIHMIGFFVMYLPALVFVLVWPKFQMFMGTFQLMMKSTGAFGVGTYAFLERILIPTGLHHFIYTPFLFDSAVVQDGIISYRSAHLQEFSQVTEPLINVFPQGGFALFGMTKVFAPLGIAGSFYTTAKSEKKKTTLVIMIPIVITAMCFGITVKMKFYPISTLVHKFSPDRKSLLHQGYYLLSYI